MSFLNKELMKKAIEEAQNALKKGQAPFGAVIVKDGKIIASAHNLAFCSNDPTAHAEIVAIRRASKKLKTRELVGYSIYSTCEPCLMCLSACYWAKIKEIVFGATVEDAKARGIRQIDVSYDNISKLFGEFFVVRAGIMRKECISLFDEWKKVRIF